MPLRQRVLFLQEEGAREFEPYTHKLRAVHQDRAEVGDGRVERLVAGLPVRCPVGSPKGLHAGPETLAGHILPVGGGGRRRAPSRPPRKAGSTGPERRRRQETASWHRLCLSGRSGRTPPEGRWAVRVCRILVVSGSLQSKKEGAAPETPPLSGFGMQDRCVPFGPLVLSLLVSGSCRPRRQRSSEKLASKVPKKPVGPMVHRHRHCRQCHRVLLSEPDRSPASSTPQRSGPLSPEVEPSPAFVPKVAPVVRSRLH